MHSTDDDGITYVLVVGVAVVFVMLFAPSFHSQVIQVINFRDPTRFLFHFFFSFFLFFLFYFLSFIRFLRTSHIFFLFSCLSRLEGRLLSLISNFFVCVCEVNNFDLFSLI